MRAVLSRAARSSHLATGLLRWVPLEPDAWEGCPSRNSSSGGYAAGSAPRAPPPTPDTPSRA